MLNFLHLTDPFTITPAPLGVAIGAPHHGTRPNVGADLGTGPIATALATALNGRLVVVSDLRRTVDVNKNPIGLGRLVRHHARRYQNELFHHLPQLLIEIHGHVSGQYDIEITTGFELDPTLPGDALFWQKLTNLQQTLPPALVKTIGQTPSIGIYPLDRDVAKTATNTYTFQKIRRARHLAGLAWYGLHIEFNADLRTSSKAQSPAFHNALAQAFTSAIQASFFPLPSATALIPTRTDFEEQAGSLPQRTLHPVLASTRFVDANLVVVHPDECAALAALDGDAVLLRCGEESLRTTLTFSRTVAPGTIALPARLRRQINANLNGRLTIERALDLPPTPATSAPNGTGYLAVADIQPQKGRAVWLSPAECQRLNLSPGAVVTVAGQPHTEPVSGVTLLSSTQLVPRTAAVSTSLADSLLLTLGDVISLKP